MSSLPAPERFEMESEPSDIRQFLIVGAAVLIILALFGLSLATVLLLELLV